MLRRCVRPRVTPAIGNRAVADVRRKPDRRADPGTAHGHQRHHGFGAEPRLHPHLAGARPGERLACRTEGGRQGAGGLIIWHQVPGHEIERADDRLMRARDEGDRAAALQRRNRGAGDAAHGPLDPDQHPRTGAEQLPSRPLAEQLVTGAGCHDRAGCEPPRLRPGTARGRRAGYAGAVMSEVAGRCCHEGGHGERGQGTDAQRKAPCERPA